MDMSLKNCWDCPIPLWGAVGQYALLFLVAATGAWIQKSSRPEVRTLGRVIMVLVFAFALLMTRAVLRWGILRSGVPFDVFARTTSFAILLGLDAMLAASVLLLARFRSRPHLAD